MNPPSAAIIARSVHGLEWVCAWEACTAGGLASSVRLSRRQVDFEVESAGPWLLGLRTADDVFARVGEIDKVGATKSDLPALGQAVAALDWPRAVRTVRLARPVSVLARFDVVVSLEGRRSYNRFAAEGSIGRALAPVLGAAFLERDGSAQPGAESDLTVRVFVQGDQATVAVRLGSRPLHRRAYKATTGPGTLHPPVAAALVMIGAPTAGTLIDPFCGDGTIAIEAALIRPGLAIVASDIDPIRVRNAKENSRRAGADIEVRLADAANLATSCADVDAIVTNPPWNQAVSAGGGLAAGAREFWDSLAAVLRRDGVLCCVTDADLQMPGLVAQRGWRLALQQRIRLAGRVADVSLASPPGRSAPSLPQGLADWRDKALTTGVVTETGF